MFKYIVYLFVLLAFSATANPADSIQCTTTADKPCQLVLKEGEPAWTISFTSASVSADEQVIKQISLTSPDDKPVHHTLVIPEMMPIFKDDTVSLYAQDLNQDGFRDIWFVTEQGTANSYAIYWLYVSEQNKFVSLGKHPWLKLDAGNQTLQSYERHGHGGRIYTESLYRIENKTLTLIKQEQQTWDSRNNKYIKKITTRQIQR